MNFKLNRETVGKLCFYVLLMIFGSDAARAVLVGVNTVTG